jgi:hypothetical protein
VRTGGEEGGVVVGGRTVEEHHVRRLACQAVDQTLTLELADGVVVERDVDVGRSAEGESVVVDGLDALAGRLLLDRGAAVGVEVHDGQHGDTVGDHAVGDRRHAVRRPLGVLNGVRHACGLEGLLECGPVLGLPADRRLGVGQDHADLAFSLGVTAAGVSFVSAAAATAAAGQGQPGADEHGTHH